MENKEEQFQIEEAFSKVEEIIKQLESDKVSLKESIALYGEGATLLGQLKEELTGIEKEMIVIGEQNGI